MNGGHIEYRHKKFDKNKRLRSESETSSSGDFVCLSVKIEQICESPYHPTYPSIEIKRKRNFSSSSQEDSDQQPLAKRAHLYTRSLAASPPKISEEILRSICKYHGNMVRKFPKKERTPKDQERRNKNTIACRMSRRVKKLEHIAIEEQYKEFSVKVFKVVEETIRVKACLHELMKLAHCPKSDDLTAHCSKALLEESAAVPPQQKTPFTIAFLAGVK